MNTPTGIVPSIIPGSKKWAGEISEEKVREKDKKIQDKLEFVSRKIKDNEKDLTSPGNFDRFKELIMTPLSNRKGVEIAFRTDDTCNGCGICEKVCLSGKVQINNGKPHWSDILLSLKEEASGKFDRILKEFYLFLELT